MEREFHLLWRDGSFTAEQKPSWSLAIRLKKGPLLDSSLLTKGTALPSPGRGEELERQGTVGASLVHKQTVVCKSYSTLHKSYSALHTLGRGRPVVFMTCSTCLNTLKSHCHTLKHTCPMATSLF